ncbi:MAG: hypothetical protein QXH27_03500 [Candidatus Micrarchaeia archaeon]
MEPFASVEGFYALLEKRAPVDWARIAGRARALFIGECRDVLAGKAELTENLSGLCGLGFSNLALDAWPSDAQGALDEYAFRGRGREDALAPLAAFPPEHRAALARLLDEVRRLNFEKTCRARVLALEVTDYIRRGYLREFGRQTALMREKKEEHMADVIAHFLKREPSARVVALVPSVYAQTNHAPRRVETAAGVETVSVRLIGGKKRFPGAAVRFQRIAEKAIRRAGLAGERFCVQLPPSTRGPFFDWLLHLPQAEEPSRAERSPLFILGRGLGILLQEARAKLAGIDNEEKF